MARIASGENPSSRSTASRNHSRSFLSALFWCAIIGFELFLLLNDITLFQSPKSETPENTGERIAEIREKRNGVRWQSPKDVVWNEGAVGQALFEGQSVMTLSDSSARLIFDATPGATGSIEGTPTQTELEIGPKTLVQLKRLQPEVAGSEAPLLVLLERGKIQSFTTKRKIRLRTKAESTKPEKTIEIDAGSKFEAEIPVTPAGEAPAALEMKLTEGAARVVETSGAAAPVKAGDTVRLSDEVAPVVASTPVASVVPSETPSPEPSPTPSLAPSPKPKSLRALPPPKVQAPVLRKRVTRPVPHSWFEKVIRFFGIEGAEAAEANTVDEFEIELRWDPVPDATAYRIQIAKTRRFDNLLVDEIATGPKWIWIYHEGMGNSKGRVFYRVATIGPTKKVGKFSIVNLVVLPKPEKKPVVVAKPKVEPIAKSVVPVVVPSHSEWRIAPLAQYGSFSQDTDLTVLRSVSVASPFVSQGLHFEYEPENHSVYQIDLRMNHFESTSGALAKTLSIRGDATWTGRPRLWGKRLAWGALLSFDDHFAKADLQTLKLESGVSLGPVFVFSADQTRLSLGVPVTGLFGGGSYGLKASLEHRFFLSRDGGWVPRNLVAAAMGDYLFWKDPSGTKITRWAIRVGPEWVIE